MDSRPGDAKPSAMGTRCVASAATSGMSEDHGNDEQELRRLRSEVAAQRRDIHDLDDLEHRQEELIARLREEAAVREGDLAALRERLAAAEHELEDLRAIRDALTPPELPRRPGLELAAAFLPAIAEQLSGDFYLVAEGPQDSTVLVVGDVVGHGLQAARRAAFIRTTFAATAPFSDDPCRLLSWANTALIERAGVSTEFVTAACVTSLPSKQILRWAYAGHPPALWLDDGHELIAPTQGTPLGLGPDPGFVEGSQRATAGAGVLLYTDGLTEARHDGQMFGLDGVIAALGGLHRPSPTEASPSCAHASPTSPTAP
jgi:serine phosphatase RsbU (regulator of sigma subunit)